jgi:hypothetical protein
MFDFQCYYGYQELRPTFFKNSYFDQMALSSLRGRGVRGLPRIFVEKISVTRVTPMSCDNSEPSDQNTNF